MKTVVISDCHIGAMEADIGALLAFLDQLDCDRLLIAGDLWELWTRRPSFLSAYFRPCVLAFEGARKRGIRVEYLLGNHDETYLNDPLIPLDIMPVVGRMEIPLPCGRKLAVIHGHEYDHLIKWYYPLMRLGYWAKQVISGFAYVEHASLSSKKSHKDYSKLASAMHWEACRTYRQLGYAGLIMGHTHSPIFHQFGDFTFADAGDWKGSNTYVEVDTGAVSLNTFKRLK
jgi:UDP-2,3-diacylglucosamine pyrophosphatase LpxH